MQKQLSIHPRNWPSGNGVTKNTSVPRKKGSYYTKAIKKLTQRQNAWIADKGQRKPGSMRLDQ